MVPQQFDDFKLIIGRPHLPNTLIELIKSEGIDFNSLDNQIITPTNKGWIGQVALNQAIQKLLKGDQMYEAVLMPREKWDKNDLFVVTGDKVIWKKNEYNLGIFNGETGIIKDLDNDCVTVDFGDRVVSVPPWIEYTTPDGQIKGYDTTYRDWERVL